MAIKTSNPITITEQKIIKEIKEWYLATSIDTGVTTETEGWTTTAQIIDPINKYLWNYEEVIYSIGSSDKSEPILIGTYSKSIRDIVNYYAVTEDTELPEEVPDGFWSDNLTNIGTLSKENKYLWNYEAIIYTDTTSTTTTPAIIGVYGDSGENAIVFQIYSPTGDTFKDGVSEIELKTAAFSGSSPITGETYVWSYYVPITDTWVEIGDTINLIVPESAEYAIATFKCVMTYNNKQYEDFFSLRDFRNQYVASIKFFNGSNMFGETDHFLVAYVSLYKDDRELDALPTTNYYFNPTNRALKDGTIYSDIDINTVEDGEMMYFVCVDDNDSYYIILGKYSTFDNLWILQTETREFVYTNTIYPNSNEKIIVISRKDIIDYQELSVNVYQPSLDENGNQIYSADLLLAHTYATIANLNGMLSETIDVVNNVKQYMRFDPDTGLKIAQNSDKFYVNIDATEMGFYDNTNANNPHNKIVSIGTNSATIKNMVVVSDGETPAEFKCNAKFNQSINIQGFVFQVEQNGSFSLAIAN